MDPKFTAQLKVFSSNLSAWSLAARAKLLSAHQTTGLLMQGEVKKRVPVKDGRLRRGINQDTTRTGFVYTTEIGTNVRDSNGFPYPKVLEYGSKHIAGGKVAALGTGSDITDANAITEWQAKAERGGTGQQMPFFRPAFNKVVPVFKGMLLKIFTPRRGFRR